MKSVEMRVLMEWPSSRHLIQLQETIWIIVWTKPLLINGDVGRNIIRPCIRMTIIMKIPIRRIRSRTFIREHKNGLIRRTELIWPNTVTSIRVLMIARLAIKRRITMTVSLQTKIQRTNLNGLATCPLTQAKETQLPIQTNQPSKFYKGRSNRHKKLIWTWWKD